MEASARWNAGQGPLLDTQEDTEPSPAPADKEPGVTSNENAYAHNREMQQQEAAHIQGNSDREEVNARWTILEGPLSFLFDTQGDAEPFSALARDDTTSNDEDSNTDNVPASSE